MTNPGCPFDNRCRIAVQVTSPFRWICGRWRIASPILLATALCLTVSCGRNQKNVDPAGVAFAYTDSSGKRLLTLSDDNVVIDSAKARAMTTAVCSEGSVFPLRYLQLQRRTSGDTGRQSVYNFDNDEGHLFEFARDRGKLSEPYLGETCLLVPDNYLQRFPIAPNDLPMQEREARSDVYAAKVRESETRKQPMDLTPFQPVGDFAKSALARIEKGKARPATLYFPLYRIGVSQQIAVVEFVPVGQRPSGKHRSRRTGPPVVFRYAGVEKGNGLLAR